jgi:hypothetical protein
MATFALDRGAGPGSHDILSTEKRPPASEPAANKSVFRPVLAGLISLNNGIRGAAVRLFHRDDLPCSGVASALELTHSSSLQRDRERTPARWLLWKPAAMHGFGDAALVHTAKRSCLMLEKPHLDDEETNVRRHFRRHRWGRKTSHLLSLQGDRTELTQRSDRL